MKQAALIPSFNINAISASEVDIKIFDVIGQSTDWWTGEKYGIAYEDFEKEFKAAEAKYARLNIRINSVGGSVHVGNAMYNLMAATKKEIHTYIDGVAYSMSAVLAQVAPKGNRHAATNALYMLHAASTYSYDAMNASSMRECADMMDKYDQSLASSLADNLGLTKDEIIAKYFDGKDHFFTADEMLAEGLIDTIENYKAEQYTSAKDLTKATQEYYKVAAQKTDKPVSVIAEFTAALKEFFSPINQSNPKNQPIMADLKSIQEKFNSAGDKGLILTTEEVAAFKAEIASYTEAKHTETELTAAVNTAVEAKTAELQKIIDEKQAIIDQKPTPAGGAGTEDPAKTNAKQSYTPINQVKF